MTQQTSEPELWCLVRVESNEVAMSLMAKEGYVILSNIDKNSGQILKALDLKRIALSVNIVDESKEI